MTREERLKAARDFVNERRKELGLRATSRLSKGYPYDAKLCVIAKSLEKVGVMAACPGDDGTVSLEGFDSKGVKRVRVFQSPETAQFMRAFDRGEYPELVVKRKPIKVGGEVVA